MANIIQAIVLGSGVAAIAITGDYLYVRRSWKIAHPLVAEGMELLQKNEMIVKHLGQNYELNSRIKGVLESGKSWANFHFEVRGSRGVGRVSILADCKLPSETNDFSDFPLEGSQPHYTLLEKIQRQIGMAELSEETPHWRIVTLHFKPDENHSIPVIADGICTHRQLKETKEAQNTEQITSQAAVSLRRAKTYQKIQERYMYMLGFGAFGAITFFITRRYIRVHPVGNSVFLQQALHIAGTDLKVRNQLGVPIKSLQFVKGKLNYNFAKGECEALIYGPKNYGRLRAVGAYNAAMNKWIFSTLRVKIDQDTHSLVQDSSIKP